MTCTHHEPTWALENMKQSFDKYPSKETPLILAIYRCVWLCVVVTTIITLTLWLNQVTAKPSNGKTPLGVPAKILEVKP